MDKKRYKKCRKCGKRYRKGRRCPNGCWWMEP